MTAVTKARGGSVALRKARMLIGGKWVDSAAGEVFRVEDPAHRAPIAEVPRGRAEDVDRAMKAAAGAFPAWSRTPPRERGRILGHIADALEARVEELARTIALETGNAIRTQSRPEAKNTIDILRYFSGLGGELKGVTIPLGESVHCYTRREPLGVVGAIVPWNAPVLLSAVKIGPALCAGNTMVLKAAEDAPLGVLLLAEVCQQFLPPGVLNVLTGFGEECGAPLARHPIPRKLSFTGSTAVGKSVMHAAADRIVPISLELGGKSPSIVFPDANEDWVLDGMVAAMRFSRQSQSCTAGSRLFLHRDIFDDFLEGLGRKVKALKIGDPLDEASDIGTIINEKQFKKVCGYVEEGLKQRDARVVIGGLPPTDGPLSEGYYRHPHHLRQRRQRLAVGARGDLWTGVGGYSLVRRGRRHPHGQRQPLWACRLCLVTRYRQSAAHRARHRSPAGCKSIRVSARAPVIPTAAIRKAASAASSRSKACSTATPRARTSPST